MKSISIIPFIFALFVLRPTTGKAQVTGISLFDFAWNITFEPNGRVSACYGSIGEDCLIVKEGSVNFLELLATIDTAERKARPESGDFQIYIRRNGQVTYTSFALKDQSFIIQLLYALDTKWKPIHPAFRKRIMDIKRKNPIVPKL
jgi:hypothetical protein